MCYSFDDGALFSTYTVVNNSYNQVVDKASVSRSSRDLVGMMVKDIRLAGFKYYYGENTEDIPAFENLTHISGTEEGRDLIDSHDPLIVERNILGYIPADGVETIVKVDEETTDTEASDTIDVTTNISGICCDRISVVYGDFDKRDPRQNIKNIELLILQIEWIVKQTKNYSRYTKLRNVGWSILESPKETGLLLQRKYSLNLLEHI